MAFNYPNLLRNEVDRQKADYILNGFNQAEAELSGLSIPNNVYFRDIFWDFGANQIKEVSTGNQVSGLTLQKQFLYYPQLLQLLVRAYDYVFYPL
jgi:hypothetical protein